MCVLPLCYILKKPNKPLHKVFTVYSRDRKVRMERQLFLYNHSYRYNTGGISLSSMGLAKLINIGGGFSNREHVNF